MGEGGMRDREGERRRWSERETKGERERETKGEGGSSSCFY